MTPEENGIRDTVSKDRATVSPAANETPNKDSRMQGDQTDAEREESHSEDTRLEDENVANVPQEYLVDRIVRHVGKDDKVKYVVHWYGYMPVDDTVELLVHIAEQFFIRFGARGKNKRQGNRDTEMEIKGDKECTPPTVQAKASMKI